MAFAQLTYRDSLRDIEACFRSSGSSLYHMGIRGKVARNTMSNANAKRNWRIYSDFAQVLIQRAVRLYSGDNICSELQEPAYAFDSTTIDLCLSLFPWAKFRKHKAAVKMHTLYDIGASIPTVVFITPGKVHDVKMMDELTYEAGSMYVFDRAYLDYVRLYRIHLAGAFFVIRTKSNSQLNRLYSSIVDKTSGLKSDQTVSLKGFYSSMDYQDKLRRISYYDKDTDRHLSFLTNNFTLPAIVVPGIYKRRWDIEIFFKWIKGHLRIKSFFGTTDNAVKTQIWIAISIYILVAIIRKELKLNHSLHTILQILSVNIFQKTPILQLFQEENNQQESGNLRNQLLLFN